MASVVPPKKGVVFSFEFALVSTTDTDNFQTNPTLATGDVKVSKDGASFANIATLPSAIDAGEAITVTLSTTEMTADRVAVQFEDAAGDEWQGALVMIFTSAQLLDEIDTNVDSILADTGTDGVVLADSAITSIFSYVAEGALTFVQMFRVAYAVLAGKSSGGGTSTIVFRDVADGVNRVSTTVDGDGNRTAINNVGTYPSASVSPSVSPSASVSPSSSESVSASPSG